MTDRGLRPFFTFYGGKWRVAKKYPIPRHGTVVEPFAGSAGYSLRYPDRNVVLVDLDPIICATWEYLISVDKDEILALPDLLPGQSVDSLDVTEGAKLLIGWWCNKGATGPRKTLSNWSANYPEGGFWGESVRRRVAEQLNSIRHWSVVNADFRFALQEEPCTYFVDPPYQVAGKHYRFGSSSVDYDDLAVFCQEIWEGQVIVCENEGATWLPFRPFARIKANEGSRGGKVSAEVIWTTGGIA